MFAAAMLLFARGPRQTCGGLGRILAASTIGPAEAAAGLVRASARFALIGRYAVEGHSMEPAYRAGDRVLVNRFAYLLHPPTPGDVVVLRDPEREGRYLLKRVAVLLPSRAPASGAVYVLGDNAADSRDSRHFGAAPASAIVGKAWLRY